MELVNKSLPTKHLKLLQREGIPDTTLTDLFKLEDELYQLYIDISNRVDSIIKVICLSINPVLLPNLKWLWRNDDPEYPEYPDLDENFIYISISTAFDTTVFNIDGIDYSKTIPVNFLYLNNEAIYKIITEKLMANKKEAQLNNIDDKSVTEINSVNAATILNQCKTTAVK